MASTETDASADRRRRMLILNQKLDNPMDTEAEKLRGGYGQKVKSISSSFSCTCTQM